MHGIGRTSGSASALAKLYLKNDTPSRSFGRSSFPEKAARDEEDSPSAIIHISDQAHALFEAEKLLNTEDEPAAESNTLL